MNDGANNIRLIKAEAALPKVRQFYRMPAFSEKKLKQIEQQRKSGSDKVMDAWFDHQCATYYPICVNCGMEASWLTLEKFKYLWRSCQAHILPKRDTMFPSLKTNLDNHLVLFPAFSGRLCGCHDLFDLSWQSAKNMHIWPYAVEVFKTKLYPLIPEHEKKHIPDVLLMELTKSIDEFS